MNKVTKINNYIVKNDLYMRGSLTGQGIVLGLFGFGFLVRNFLILGLFFSVLASAILFYCWNKELKKILLIYIVLLVYLAFPIKLFENPFFKMEN